MKPTINSTGMYRAFSEGPTGSTDWAYEWVVYDNKTWVVRAGDGDNNITPIIYTKIAFSFLAVYNTTYARNMVIFLEERLGKTRQMDITTASTKLGQHL